MFVASTLALMLVAPPNDTYELKWKLKEGDVFYNKTRVTLNQTIEGRPVKQEEVGRPVKQEITVDTVLKFKVKSVKQGTTIVEMTYLESKIAPAAVIGGNIGDKLKNATFTATLDDKMEITKLEGYDAFLEAFADGDNAQKKELKVRFPESAVRQIFGRTFEVVSTKPLTIGEGWERTNNVSLGPLGNVETKIDYKLDSVKSGVAAVSIKGDLRYKPNKTDLPFKITKVRLKTETFTGTAKFDLTAGRLTASEVVIEVSGPLTIAAATGEKSIDAKIHQKLTTTTTITDKIPSVE